MIKRHPEPLLWMLFSAGGVVSAMLMPALAVAVWRCVSSGMVESPWLRSAPQPAGKSVAAIGMFSLCTLSLFHWAHRFRHTLYDGLQIKHLNEMVAVLSYGAALAGSGLAAYLLWQLA